MEKEDAIKIAQKQLTDIYSMYLTEIIDELYLEMKDDFVDYEGKTHKLGFFKEEIKRKFSLLYGDYAIRNKLK